MDFYTDCAECCSIADEFNAAITAGYCEAAIQSARDKRDAHNRMYHPELVGDSYIL